MFDTMKSIDEETAEFIQHYRRRRSDRTRSEVAAAQAENIRRRGLAPTTIISYLNAYRAALKPLKNGAVGIEAFKPTLAELSTEKNRAAKVLKLKRSNLKPVLAFAPVVEKALKMLTAKSDYDVLLALCVLTGRRGFEIATHKPDHFQHVCGNIWLFSGQAKTKGRGVVVYEIPVHCPPSLLLPALERVRLRFARFADDQRGFNRIATPELGVRVKKAFLGVGTFPMGVAETLTVKDLRAFYAEYTFDLLTDKTIAKTRYFSDILGHGELDNATGASYEVFYLQNQ